jgi:hypothetical protein
MAKLVKSSISKRARSDSAWGCSCVLIGNDSPYGNERSYNELRLTTVAGPVQEP